MYVIHNKMLPIQLSLYLIANHLYGPSYVLLDYALQHYGAIPEQVKMITSVTTKSKKIISCPLGNYSYLPANKEYYPVGIVQYKISDTQYALLASPEKH